MHHKNCKAKIVILSPHPLARLNGVAGLRYAFRSIQGCRRLNTQGPRTTRSGFTNTSHFSSNPASGSVMEGYYSPASLLPFRPIHDVTRPSSSGVAETSQQCSYSLGTLEPLRLLPQLSYTTQPSAPRTFCYSNTS
jgi:hypothetical protein